MLLSESKRDEFVTHLALDLGYNNEQIRQAVIDAGFEPLPVENANSRRERCRALMQEDLDLIKSKMAKRLFKRKDEFTDFDYDDGKSDWLIMGFEFTANHVKYTCYGTADNNDIEHYTLIPTDEMNSGKFDNSIVVRDYQCGDIVEQFIKKFCTVNRS